MTVIVERIGQETVMTADLAPGELAYVDGAWIEQADGTPLSVAAIHYLDGSLQFASGPLVTVPEGMEPDTAARLTLGSVAGEAAAAVAGIDPLLVEVTGCGIVAADVERLLGIRRDEPTHPDRPQAIVETTGSPAVLVEALERVADLGVVVLAADTRRELEYDFYPHVHVRGLQVVGVAPAVSGTISWTDERFPEVPPFLARGGSPLPTRHRWYRLSAE